VLRFTAPIRSLICSRRVGSSPSKTVLLVSICGLSIIPKLTAERQPGGHKPEAAACSRAPEGSDAAEPPNLRSKDGILKVSLTVRNSLDQNGHMRYCYVDAHENYAPTLRMKPGDTLVVTLKNEISLRPTAANAMAAHAISTHHDVIKPGRSLNHNPCAGGPMGPAATNLHFHGLSIPPVCHQDETLKTLIEPGDRPFEYRVAISKDQAPGMYWYHPHIHGFTEDQILGGLSGAIIVEGMERAVPRVAGLGERVFVVRDELMPPASSAEQLDPKRPTKQISINNVPVPYPRYPSSIIKMKPEEPQFWRVLNASADTYIDLAVEYGGKRQNLSLVALDGVPLRYDEHRADTYAPQQSHIFMPPATRAEFIVPGLPRGVSGHLLTNAVYRGAEDDGVPVSTKSVTQPALRVGLDDVDSARPLAMIIPAEDYSAKLLRSSSVAPELQIAPLSSIRPIRKRTIYFSEKLVNTSDPNSATLFFVTQEGQEPAVFDPQNPASIITVRQGDVEDWIIENRSRESHTFHVHQLHFIVVGGQTAQWEASTLRDTIDVPAWTGIGTYPRLTVRMDFRNPRIVGLFPFHCHIAQHSDGGMMGLIRVEPASGAAAPQ
jgi:FtsP/CotA-like multicopper oxidase with cupredoxin domain